MADDSATFRSALCEYLKTLRSITVVGEAVDGVQALELIERLGPDLLILDLSMPKMDGYEVLRRLRVLGSPVKVVILTGHANAYFDRLIQEGAVACLEKSKGPIALAKLLSQLAETHTHPILS